MFLFKYLERRLQERAWFGLYQNHEKCKDRFNFVESDYVGYIMGLARIIFNKSNKTLWSVTLSVV